WGWSNMEKYWRRTSTLVRPTDDHDTSCQADPDAHGYGPVQVNLAGFKNELEDHVVSTAKLLGGRFAYNRDINAGNTLGVGTILYILISTRLTHTATAYLQPAMDRSNLDVVISTRVTR
ncbi:hypothetical protein BDZ89DRAFT_915721, partial [Hymenopellis radicata]